MNNMIIAETILRQLGGMKFLSMTGSKHLMYFNNGLHMKLVKNISGANYLTIELMPNDTYKMRFFKKTGGSLNKRTFEITPLKEKDIKVLEGIYAEQLQEIFTDITGLDTHL